MLETSPPALEGAGGTLVAGDPVAQQMRWRTRPTMAASGATLSPPRAIWSFRRSTMGGWWPTAPTTARNLLDLRTLRAAMVVTYELDNKECVVVMGGTGLGRPRNLTSAPSGPPRPLHPVCFLRHKLPHHRFRRSCWSSFSTGRAVLALALLVWSDSRERGRRPCRPRSRALGIGDERAALGSGEGGPARPQLL